jgi:hypothetical protein
MNDFQLLQMEYNSCKAKLRRNAEQKEMVDNWYNLAKITFEKIKIAYQNTAVTDIEKLTSSFELTALLNIDLDYLRNFLIDKGFPYENLTIYREDAECIVIKISLL